MAILEIEYIRKSIRDHLQDVHIILSEKGADIDTQYYNDVTLALLRAEDMIKVATAAHEKRIQDHFDRYGPPNLTVD